MAIPLGVSGRFTIEDMRLAEPNSQRWLRSDVEREAYITERLREAARRPLTSSGGEVIFERVCSALAGVDVCAAAAPKILQTLRDDREHSRMMFSPALHCALQFVAWPGTHQEVFARRYGVYLGELGALVSLLTSRGHEPAAVLQMDAYVRENVDLALPDEPPDRTFAVDVEFSYVPGPRLLTDPNPTLPRVVMLNRHLCTPEELAQFGLLDGQ